MTMNSEQNTKPPQLVQNLESILVTLKMKLALMGTTMSITLLQFIKVSNLIINSK